jgi:hypothetical protein
MIEPKFDVEFMEEAAAFLEVLDDKVSGHNYE